VSGSRIRLNATVLGAPDPRTLALFYQQLLGWDRGADRPEWVTLSPRPIGTGLSFQLESDFVPPAWPTKVGEQQMTMHLDIAVEDLEASVARASELGARIEDHQPQNGVRVMRDPVGHLFCLFEGSFD
jgi:catechol 2,3-dioxygenase-like lactoylglutathione lyase family enzyme